MSLTNKAAWLDGKGEKLRVGPADVGKPGPGEVLVKNHAIAVNPVDWVRQDVGMMVRSWPTLLGIDLAGEVVEVGQGVSDISKGQRVLAHALGIMTGKPENASFQNYAVVSAAVTCPISDSMTYEAASVIPLGLSTAATGLYPSDYLALPFPTTSPKKSGKAILIWGGSSSVGSAAIQLAVASGLDVFATASKKNFEYCKKLGAHEVFDYSSSSIVDDLTAALQKRELAGALDAIGKRDTTVAVAKVLEKFGGGFIASVLPPPEDLPASVKVKQIRGSSIVDQPHGLCKAVYKDFLPAALKSGQFKPAPEPEVIGKGLDHLQAAVDKLRKGVSARKLVVTL